MSHLHPEPGPTPAMTGATPMFFGVSLKMYFGRSQALRWCERVAALASRNPALINGQAELAVLPSFTALSAAIGILDGTSVGVGAQDLFWEDGGAFTGEVGGAELAEMGCRFVEVGHAERRAIFAETDAIVARKVAAAIRNRLTPILCIGEEVASSAEEASDRCISQLESAVGADSEAGGGRAASVVVAYEPVWAIGAQEPAGADHIGRVCASIRLWLDRSPLRDGSRVIYGGSAGRGLLTELDGRVDGLFLGRFAHDPDNLERIVTEGATKTGRSSR